MYFGGVLIWIVFFVFIGARKPDGRPSFSWSSWDLDLACGLYSRSCGRCWGTNGCHWVFYLSACFCLETFPVLCSIRIILIGDDLLLLVTLFPLKVRLTFIESDAGLVGSVVLSFAFVVAMASDWFSVLLYRIRLVICLKVRRAYGGY